MGGRALARSHRPSFNQFLIDRDPGPPPFPAIPCSRRFRTWRPWLWLIPPQIILSLFSRLPRGGNHTAVSELLWGALEKLGGAVSRPLHQGPSPPPPPREGCSEEIPPHLPTTLRGPSLPRPSPSLPAARSLGAACLQPQPCTGASETV